MLSVTFLRTGAACPTIDRNVSGLAIAREGETLLFDCGEGTQRQMMRYGTSFSFTEVFFSHWHADHFLGITGLLRTLGLLDRTLPMTLYGQDIRMAYMDVPAQGQPNGRTVVLFHGMNFAGFYWGGPIDALRKEGFRVVVPDQIGFGRSSKPIIPYNFHDMARNTRLLLQHLKIDKAFIQAKIGRLSAAMKGTTLDDKTQGKVDELFKQATSAYGDGKFSRANRQLNEIWALIRRG